METYPTSWGEKGPRAQEGEYPEIALNNEHPICSSLLLMFTPVSLVFNMQAGSTVSYVTPN